MTALRWVAALAVVPLAFVLFVVMRDAPTQPRSAIAAGGASEVDDGPRDPARLTADGPTADRASRAAPPGVAARGREEVALASGTIEGRFVYTTDAFFPETFDLTLRTVDGAELVAELEDRAIDRPWTFEDVPVGHYAVEATPSGEDAPAGRRFDVAVFEGDVTSTALHLVRARIEGYVRSTSGERLRGIRVSALAVPQLVFGDTGGAVQFFPDHGASSSLIVPHAGPNTMTLTFEVAEETGAFELSPPAPTRIVRHPQLGGAPLEFHPTDGVRACVTDEHGRFTIDVSPGDVLVSADDPKWFADQESVQALVDGENRFVVLELEPAVALEGYARLPDGSLAPGVEVFLRSDRRGEHVRTDGVGRFSFPKVHPIATRLYARTGGDAGQDFSAIVDLAPFELEREQEVPVRLTRSGILRGEVLDQDGDPCPGLEVTARSADNERVTRTGTTDAEGRYEIRGLYAARYEVSLDGLLEPLGEVRVGSNGDERWCTLRLPLPRPVSRFSAQTED